MDNAAIDTKVEQVADDMPDILVMKFADAEIPEFKEVRGKDYILFGKDNNYPDYLIYLYNKSPKHGAIINGKSKYILGNGFNSKTIVKDFTLPIINRMGENWNDIAEKGIKDVEIHGGARLMIVWDLVGRIRDVIHIEFQKVRNDKNGGFLYKEDWKVRGDATHYDEFDPNNRTGCQIFAYNEYRPGTGVYPLPEYLACNNYIETDIEISKFHLSAIKNGMMPSKAIEFFQGDPTEEKKKQIERRFETKFAGSENAGRFIMIFSPSKDKSVNITDLSASELDKQFDVLNKTVQEEIFTGHQVTSPMLFGIKTEGQLGGSSELQIAYEIFINMYAKPKQAKWERMANYFSSLCGQTADLYIEQLDPVDVQINIDTVVNFLPKQYIFEKLNVPKEYWNLPPGVVERETLNPATNPNPKAPAATEAVNDNIKNLTAKQHQQLMRIIRQFSKGQITQAAASALLKSGLGLNDAEVKSLLGVEDEVTAMRSAFDTQADENAVIQMFNECGELKSDYHIVKAKKVKFNSDGEAADDELNFFTQAFRMPKITVSEQSILDLISKDKHITPEVIGDTLGVTTEYVTNRIASLVKRGYLTTDTETVGDDTQIVRELTKPLNDIVPPDDTTDDVSEISIKYSYEGPVDSKNRPFCAKMMELDRLYSRYEIEAISQRLGYSVFDRRGGFWRHKSGLTTPYCRHNWVSNVIVKKGATT